MIYMKIRHFCDANADVMANYIGGGIVLGIVALGFFAHGISHIWQRKPNHIVEEKNSPLIKFQKNK